MGKRPRPKTGERRLVRQPLKIDLLPEAVKKCILELRAAFTPWQEIERLSHLPVGAGGFVPWAELDLRVRAAFPDSHLPHTMLHRWYDLRVEQVRREVEAHAITSRLVAQSFLGHGYENLAESIKNALADRIFGLTMGSDPEQLKKDLLEFGYLLAKLMQAQTAAAKSDVERRKLELQEERAKKEVKEFIEQGESKIRGGKRFTIDEINRIRAATLGLPPIAAAAGPAT
jgi:hypothetical protein